MREDVQAQLRRLGVVKGVRDLKPPARPVDSELPPMRPQPAAADDGEPAPLEQLLPGGRLEESHYGPCFALDRVYPLGHRHGADRLEALIRLTPAPAATFCDDVRLAGLDFRDFLFLDTETTGLVGVGTVAFMVGVAFVEGDALVVRQYFLRDYGDEPAMLQLLAGLMESKTAVVTFNGRAFDVPLLDSRFLLNRIDNNLADLPHLDLLQPARRLWRSRLRSCRLIALEQNLLGFERTLDDIPGWAIPGLYFDYLRRNDGRQMVRVFYHNEMDVLSMATLAARVVRLFAQPDAGDHPLDLVSLGAWQAGLGLWAEAEHSLRLAASLDLPVEQYHLALHQLGALLKRNGRREEAAEVWRQIAATSYDDVAAHVELAKHYEWVHRDPQTALGWITEALRQVESLARFEPGRASLLRPALDHRRARLERKTLSRSAG